MLHLAEITKTLQWIQIYGSSEAFKTLCGFWPDVYHEFIPDSCQTNNSHCFVHSPNGGTSQWTLIYTFNSIIFDIA